MGWCWSRATQPGADRAPWPGPGPPQGHETAAVDAPVIVTIETPTLGDRSYLVHDRQVGIVIDPQRDIDRILSLAEEAGVNITHVFETHIHNDYVTGGLALARATDAAYHINADDDVAYGRNPIRDDEVIEVSPTIRVRAIATPGHTFTHLSYALEARVADGAEFEAVGVFTGGSLLFGATGRPDLLGEAHTHDLVHHQFASAHRLAEDLPEQAQVLPTGSARSAPPAPPAAPPPRASGPRSGRTRRSRRTSSAGSPTHFPALTPTPPTTRTWNRRTPPGPAHPT